YTGAKYAPASAEATARQAPMKRLLFAVCVAAIPALLSAQAPARTSSPALQAPKAPQAPMAGVASHAAPVFGAAEQTALVKQYCTGCHSDRGKAGQLTLASFDASKAADADHLVTTEKMIRKLRAGMMPPATARRPAPEQIAAFAGALEARVD